MQNGRFWILTIPGTDFVPPESLTPPTNWLRGQKEIGASGYEHWQIVVGYSRAVRITHLKKQFGPTGHYELTRSAAADDYVFKEETRVQGTQFELGSKAIRRNSSTDWDKVLADAKAGEFDSIPSDVLIRCYSNLRRLHTDSLTPSAIERSVRVFWGHTGIVN